VEEQSLMTTSLDEICRTSLTDSGMPFVESTLANSEPGQGCGQSARTGAVGPRPRILMITEDAVLRKTLGTSFAEHQIDVVFRATQNETIHYARVNSDTRDLIVLDLTAKHGLELLRSVRAVTDLPVVILVTRGCDAIDRILGLESGADDYLCGPFVVGELVARIRAVLRRQGKETRNTNGSRKNILSFGGWTLNLVKRRLLNPQGKEVMLTKGEYALLTGFLATPEKPLTREQLLQKTRVHEDVFDRSIDVQVLRLRRKLKHPGTPRMIETERGIGYRFALPVQRAGDDRMAGF
jgi:two-component system OmpR family response regulator